MTIQKKFKISCAIAATTLSLLTSSLAIAQTAAPTTTAAAALKVEMQWLGQAGFRIVSPGGKLRWSDYVGQHFEEDK